MSTIQIYLGFLIACCVVNGIQGCPSGRPFSRRYITNRCSYTRCGWWCGYWNCEYVGDPSFHYCPSNQFLYADTQLTTKRVYWSEPTAYRPVYDRYNGQLRYWERLSVTRTSGYPSGSLFSGPTTGGWTDHSITYETYSSYGNSRAYCTFHIYIHTASCSKAYQVPANGHVTATSSVQGGIYTFSCDPGYNLIGSSKQTCQTDNTLSGSGQVTCQAVTCPAPPAPIYSSQTCTSSTNEYKTVCTYTCNQGYKYESQNFYQLTCTASALWTNSTGCVDVQGPVIQNCPLSEIHQLDKGQVGIVINWTSPSAVDNNDGSVTPRQTVGSSSGSFFNSTPDNQGHVITYEAKDAKGNAARPCNFTLDVRVHVECELPALPSYTNISSCTKSIFSSGTVCAFNCIPGFAIPATADKTAVCQRNAMWSKIPACVDITPPLILNCPTSVNTKTFKNVNYTIVSWDVPIVSDNVPGNYTLTMTQGQAPGSVFQVTPVDKPYVVTYQAKDQAGNSAVPCSFNITVDEYFECSEPPLPRHGSLESCTNNYTHLSTCTFVCNLGYGLPSGGIRRVTCINGGIWSDSATDCLDITPPVIDNCPSSMEVYSIRGQYFANVTWHLPTPTDNNDASVTLIQEVGSPPGSVFNITAVGVPHVIKYIAIDKAGNIAVPCLFEIRVKELKECPAPVLPTYTEISRCTDDYRVGSICFCTCQSGYSIAGNSAEITCQANSTWTTLGASCQDSLPPVFEGCPKSYVAYTERSQHNVNISWPQPNVTDTVDKNVSAIQTLGPWSGSRVSPNDSPIRVQYTAVDDAGNHAIPCEFQIIIKERICTAIPSSTKLSISYSDSSLIYGTVCTFSCEAGYEIEGNSTSTCETVPGNEALVNWSSAAPTCKVKHCIPLAPPTNGALTCDAWYFGLICKMFCNDKFHLPSNIDANTFTGEFVCDTTKGSWSPYSTVPNCVVPNGFITTALPARLTYTGQCSDNSTQEQLKAKFIDSLKTSTYSTFCTSKPDDCIVDNVVVKCGTVTKRSIFDFLLGRKARSTDQIEITFVLRIKAQDSLENSTSGEKMDTMTGLLDEWLGTIGDAITNGTLVLDVDGASFEPDRSTLEQTAQYELECDPGSEQRFSDFVCVPCGAGTFMKRSDGKCYSCPIGEYQDEDGQVTCKPCPYGYSTSTNRTRNSTECKEKCVSGSYSPEGVKPCLPCPVGQYQESAGEMSCHTCHDGLTTTTTGANSSALCRPVDDNPCTKNPCNGHTCGTVNGQFKCYCENGWTGLTCLVPPDPCANHACRNYATCEANGFYNYTCLCVENYYGALCENRKELSPCAMDPCHGHPCVASSGQFECFCQSGFTGSTCEVPPDPCSNNDCKNGATCVAVGSDFNCTCADGFEGITCENVFEPPPKSLCESDPCNGHLCQGTPNVYQCICDHGWTGTNCNIPADPCSNNACLNGGTCVAHDTNYTCVCIGKYSGELCQNQIVVLTDPCIPNPCNNQSCTALNKEFLCTCNQGWQGTNCEIKESPCSVNPCLNNGTCMDAGDNFTCSCNSNHCGHLCEKVIVNGIWSNWTDWTPCDTECGAGKRNRSRVCTPPGECGQDCEGELEQVENCQGDHCKPNISIACPDPEIHPSTQIYCTTEETIKSCNISCPPGLVFEETRFAYIECGEVNNYTWPMTVAEPDKARLPACVQAVIPEKIESKQTIEIQMSSECTDAMSAEALESTLTNLEDGDLVCIECSQATTASCRSSRDKRFAPILGILQETGNTMQIVIQHNISSDPKWDYANDSVAEKWDRLLSDMANSALGTNDLLKSGNFTITINGEHFTVEEKDVVVEAPPPSCAKGLVLSEGLCVSCAPGTFYDEATTSCVACALGFYQEKEAQLNCDACPEGMTTNNTGARDIKSCYALPEDYENEIPYYTTLASVISNDKQDSTPIIIGCAVGGAVLLAIVTLIIFFVKKMKSPRFAHKMDQATIIENNSQANNMQMKSAIGSTSKQQIASSPT